MGALHEGHLSLIKEAQAVANLVVCSIFVNPTQFNDPADLAKYPRPIESDIALLQAANCDVLFMPSTEEMYPEQDEIWSIDLGDLDRLWEGEKRPGHFLGVTQIVYKLFSLVAPDFACFGQKDYQQIMVIQRMISLKNLAIQLVICPIIRSNEGLALSSRNARLSEAGKTKALALSKALYFIKENQTAYTVQELQEKALALIAAEKEIDVEYLAICESSSLKAVEVLEDGKNHVVLLTARVENIRLIDNIILN